MSWALARKDGGGMRPRVPDCKRPGSRYASTSSGPLAHGDDDRAMHRQHRSYGRGASKATARQAYMQVAGEHGDPSGAGCHGGRRLRRSMIHTPALTLCRASHGSKVWRLWIPFLRMPPRLQKVHRNQVSRCSIIGITNE